MMVYMDSGLKKFTSIHEILSYKMNRCTEEADIPRTDDQGEDYSDPKNTP